MKRSRRELSIDIVIHRVIFKNNQIALFPCFTYLDQDLDFIVNLQLTTKTRGLS